MPYFWKDETMEEAMELIEKYGTLIGPITPNYAKGRRMGLTDDETEEMAQGIPDLYEYIIGALYERLTQNHFDIKEMGEMDRSCAKAKIAIYRLTQNGYRSGTVYLFDKTAFHFPPQIKATDRDITAMRNIDKSSRYRVYFAVVNEDDTLSFV